jgi:multicomponent Na+:H+ antiporter subunit E
MLHSFGAAVILFAFWLLLSGYFTAFLMSAGLGCAIATVLFARRIQVADREGLPLHLTLRLVPYWLWLLKEIAKSGWQVSKIIVARRPRRPMSGS